MAKFLFWLICVCVVDVVSAIEIVYNTEEEVSGKKYLGQISQNDNFININLTNAEYTILADSQYKDYFTIDEVSRLYLVRSIDREQICPRQTECSVSIQIGIKYGTQFHIVNVKVNILDINDNPPKFSQEIQYLSIPEGITMGLVYELPGVRDEDIGQNSIQNFSIEPDTNNFSIERTNSLDGSIVLNLKFNLNLDRESQDRYQILVKAIDGGSPPKTGVLTVIINVTDINDNKPVFEPREYNTTVDEDIVEGSNIIQVTATDRDIGENGKLQYSITRSEPVGAISFFGINETTGLIYLITRFTAQYGPTCKLFVEARDHGTPSAKKDQVLVTVNIRDKNDNRPEIQITVLADGVVKENTQIGTAVAHIQVQDDDTGLNGEAVCTCQNTNFTIHKINGTTKNNFRVDVGVQLDRETLSSCVVTINCSDQGVPSLSTIASFNLTIGDINDNRPVFSKQEYSGNMTENNARGAVILKVTATDADIGVNGDLLYRIEPFEHFSRFSIEENTGIIKADVSFDREDIDAYSFTVVVKDKSDSPLEDRATVSVRILDMNDNSPAFAGQSYSMFVLENSNISTSTGYVFATDDDLGDNQRISYQIPANYSHLPFTILDDGTIVTTAVLDREHISSYQFHVMATDHGSPPLSSIIPVTVLVRDENDNPPHLEFPYGDNNTITVPHSTLPDTIITTIIADDLDEKENKKLIYGIISGNDEGIFRIDSSSGQLFLNKQIFDGSVKFFTLTISVRDSGQTSLEARATLHVEFYIANDTAVGSTGSSGSQNILIAIIMSCVTFVLSVIIIAIICVIRTKDRRKNLFNANKAYDEQKIMSSHRNSNRSSSSRGSGDKMIKTDSVYTDNVYQLKKGKKEVSFSMDDEPDHAVSMDTGGQFDKVSTFKAPSPVPSQSMNYDQQMYRQETPPPKPERSDDKKQREIHRMTSLRVHQALIQSHNNNNHKHWPQSPSQEETGKTFIGLRSPLDDCHSETSGETTTSDSGRGGSEEDIRSNMTNSHDADESRSPNTSSTHPFYTTESQQPSFSSFHGNSVHKAGPILSSFMNRNQRSSDLLYQNPYPLNDLSKPHRNNSSNHRHSSENNLSQPQSKVLNNSALPYLNSFGKGPKKLDADLAYRGSKPSNVSFSQPTHYDNELESNTGQEDDRSTTTSGSYTVNDLTDDMMNIDNKDMFYKPDTFV